MSHPTVLLMQSDCAESKAVARILSVSYDSSLLKTRAMLLESRGHQVVSALGFTEALKECSDSGSFDLFIIGHSIPHSDKEVLISAFRSRSTAPIIALTKVGERVVRADIQMEPNPEQVLGAVLRLTKANRAAGD